jgi:hypothetical protein
MSAQAISHDLKEATPIRPRQETQQMRHKTRTWVCGCNLFETVVSL